MILCALFPRRSRACPGSNRPPKSASRHDMPTQQATANGGDLALTRAAAEKVQWEPLRQRDPSGDIHRCRHHVRFEQRQHRHRVGRWRGCEHALAALAATSSERRGRSGGDHVGGGIRSRHGPHGARNVRVGALDMSGDAGRGLVFRHAGGATSGRPLNPAAIDLAKRASDTLCLRMARRPRMRLPAR